MYIAIGIVAVVIIVFVYLCCGARCIVDGKEQWEHREDLQ
jgi:hypothetical protein